MRRGDRSALGHYGDITKADLFLCLLALLLPQPLLQDRSLTHRLADGAVDLALSLRLHPLYSLKARRLIDVDYYELGKVKHPLQISRRDI